MPTPINRYVGSRLQLARQRVRLTEVQMARKLNIDPFVYRDYETGRRRLEAPEMLRCSRVTGVPLSWFFEGFTREVPVDAPSRATGEAMAGTAENVVELKPHAGGRSTGDR